MAKCPYGKCDVDKGDDYCDECLKDLEEHRRLAERVKKLPPAECETPEGQEQIEKAVKEVGEMFKRGKERKQS